MPSKKIECFAAYPSKPDSLNEIIEGAIKQINSGQVVDIKSWKSTKVSGKFIITSICGAIDESKMFICDLTNLNNNVLFELGYAIAKQKRIWIVRDPSIEKSKIEYAKFKLLTTVGYSKYTNIRDIESAFYNEQPFNDLSSTIYKDAIESIINYGIHNMLLYLKSEIDTEASIKLTRIIQISKNPIMIDDPKEVRIQTLTWYAQKVFSSSAIIAHFLSQSHSGALFHNAKTSFVSGLAYGFGKYLLMLAHEPYESPVDYRDLLRIHKTASQCEEFAKTWLNNVEYNFNKRKDDKDEYTEKQRAYSELQNIVIGDSVAEHESGSLLSYFVPTATYTEALTSKRSIIIGRKGTGKTAIFYKLVDQIGSDKRNSVCVIKPVAYELEGIISMLKQALKKSEKGYLIESLWKFLIYTELARSIYDDLKSKPIYYDFQEYELNLINYIEENTSIMHSDFSVRLESIVNRLRDIGISPTVEQQRTKISELLHNKFITKLRTFIGSVLNNKEKVAILVDNLDKAWEPRSDLENLSELLFGLLRVSQSIIKDFEKANDWRSSVNLSLIIFLRSDIFIHAIKYARERDKLSYSRISWNDSEMLLRILEERLMQTPNIKTPNDIWTKYFCPTVKGIKTRDYFIQNILPRPRDLIILSKSAISQAINCKHTKIEEQDILEGQKKYSSYAVDSLIAENCSLSIPLEKLIYEFAGSKEVISKSDIIKAMIKCNIHESKYDEVENLLCDLIFLGREIKDDYFEYQHNEEDKEKYIVLSKRVLEKRMIKEERFSINKAFHSYLEIMPLNSMNFI